MNTNTIDQSSIISSDSDESLNELKKNFHTN